MFSGTGYDAVVIGAGFAGAVAARDLGDAGLRVAIVEARDRLGGRTWWSEDSLKGYSVEMGGGWIGEDEHLIMREVERYGIALNREGGQPRRFLWPSDNGVREAFLPVPFDQLPELEKVLARFAREAERIDPSRALADQGLEDLDVALPDFLADLDLPVETYGVLAGFWGGIASADWSEMSALSALALQAVCGGTFMGFLNTVMLGPRFKRGTGSLIDAIIADSGADVILNAPVRYVSHRRDATVVTADERTFTARAVVCAVPLNVLGAIEFDPPLSPGLTEAAARGHSGRGFKLWMVVRNAAGGIFSIGNQGAFQHLFTVEERGDESLLCGFGPGSSPPPADLERVQAALRHYAPEAQVMQAASHDWTSDPYAKGTWRVVPAGFITAYESELLKPAGRVFFAGSDFALHRPGWIEGAVHSGALAAERIITQFKGTTRPSLSATNAVGSLRETK